MQANHPDYRAIKREVESRLKQRKTVTRWVFFLITLLMFVVFVGLTISLSQRAAVLDSDLIGGIFLLGAGWFTSVLFHMISATLDTKASEDLMRVRIMAQVMGESLLDPDNADGEAPAEKAKRMMRLTDDGELEEIVLDTDLPQANSASDDPKAG